jgi:hypothetical protein
MSYVVYHKDTTRYLCKHPKVRTDLTRFATETAAKAALTREAKRGRVNREDFLIASSDDFVKIEKTEVKHNLLSGTPFTQSVNTPIGCDPSSETYWSM